MFMGIKSVVSHGLTPSEKWPLTAKQFLRDIRRYQNERPSRGVVRALLSMDFGTAPPPRKTRWWLIYWAVSGTLEDAPRIKAHDRMRLEPGERVDRAVSRGSKKAARQ